MTAGRLVEIGYGWAVDRTSRFTALEVADYRWRVTDHAAGWQVTVKTLAAAQDRVRMHLIDQQEAAA